METIEGISADLHRFERFQLLLRDLVSQLRAGRIGLIRQHTQRVLLRLRQVFPRPDFIPELVITGIRILRGGLAESIEQSSIVYKSWRIINGQMQVQATREDGIDMEEYMLFNFVKLTPDSLVIRDEDDTYEYTHPTPDDDELEDGVNYDSGDESDYKI